MKYRWNFPVVLQHYEVILAGLWGTLKLALLTLACAVVIGIVVGIARTSSKARIRYPATMFVEFFRNIPSLVQVFWCFYALPVLTGLQTNAFTAAGIALSLYSGAYFAEIIRGGVESLERGQWEAGRAIGFSYLQSMRYVIAPQAFRRTIPALTNQAIEVVKLTTVASAIAYAELLYSARLISNQEFRPLESYTIVAVIILGVLLCLSFASARLERRLRRQD